MPPNATLDRPSALPVGANVVEKLMAEARRLPALPAVVSELLPTLGDEHADIGRIAQLVRRDPVLSARVLRAGRSAAHGRALPAMSVDQAVIRIGFTELRAVLIAGALADTLFDVSEVDFHVFWQHSAGTARLAQRLAPAAACPSDVAYTAGIVHAIGWLLLVRAFPEVELELAAGFGSAAIDAQVAAERALTGTDHAFAGALLARRWSFPSLITGAMAGYADPEERDGNALARLLWITSTLVGAGRAKLEAGSDETAAREIGATLDIARDQLALMAAAAIERSASDLELLRHG